MEAFTFNSKAKYRPGVQPDPVTCSPSLIEDHIKVQAAPSRGFVTHFPNVFDKYKLPHISSDALVKAWSTTPMQFWQNQVNFAVWCATTGCGISAQDHLNYGSDGMLQSLFLFHTYHQTRRILVEINAPLPEDKAWNPTNNPYNRRAYLRICQEFNISPHSDWHVKGPNKGLGRMYNYWSYNDYHPVEGEYESGETVFKGKIPNEGLHIDYIKQDTPGADHAWATFILKTSEGFTLPGKGRLNNIIATYIWAILGAQVQIRAEILTSSNAKKQFLVLVEDAISSSLDLPSAIDRYENVLQYARSEVNYVFGIGLYMAPSDMLLRIGKFEGYNNNLLIAKADQAVGLNSGVNLSIAPPDASNDTGEIGIVKPVDMPKPTLTNSNTGAMQIVSDHADEKTALIVGGIAIGLAVLWFVPH